MKPINSLSIGIASDHAGYDLKETIKKYLAEQGVSVTDFGTNSTDSCDYPDFAHPLASAVEQGACEFGTYRQFETPRKLSGSRMGK